MARELFGEDVEAKPQPRVWSAVPEAKFFIRPVPPAVADRYARQVAKGLKTRQLAEQQAEQSAARVRAVTRKVAAYALTETEGYEVMTRSPQLAAQLAEAIGEDVKPGQFVLLDGKWSEAVKACVFEMDPDLPAWISDEANDLARISVEREKERGKI